VLRDKTREDFEGTNGAAFLDLDSVSLSFFCFNKSKIKIKKKGDTSLFWTS
jgi:hypothetical protein